MAGFVDVSNMSDLEIKRLGQQDEDDSDPGVQRHNRRVNRQRVQTRPQTWSAQTVWAAAAYAHRINGREYRKEIEYRIDDQGNYTREVVREPNRVIMKRALADQSLLTAEDRRLGDLARDWLSKRIIMQTLKGALSEFDSTCQGVVACDHFDEWTHRMEVAVVASQIRAYEQAQILEQAMEGIDRSPVAAVGAKVNARVRVIKSVFSTNYSVYFITALTSSNQAVFFSYRDGLKIGSEHHIRGTVKAHRPDATQLNRVRVEQSQ